MSKGKVEAIELQGSEAVEIDGVPWTVADSEELGRLMLDVVAKLDGVRPSMQLNLAVNLSGHLLFATADTLDDVVKSKANFDEHLNQYIEQTSEALMQVERAKEAGYEAGHA